MESRALMDQRWWAMALRGVAAILFGVLAFALPGITLAVLVLLFGAYALVDGLFALASAFARNRPDARPWWSALIEGVFGIAIGLVTFFWPGITALSLLFLIAAWAVVTGFLELVAAVRLRKEIRGEWLLALSGVLSIVFGAALVAMPGAGALALVWLIGAYAVAFGVLMVALGFRMRRLATPGTDLPAGHMQPT